jgi:hypothetical protein
MTSGAKRLVYEVIYNRLMEIADASPEPDFIQAFIEVLSRGGKRVRVMTLFPQPAKKAPVKKAPARKAAKKR